jgi:hypothetical protein
VEFLRRFLLHVLPKGFHKIRHYGLCSASHVALSTLADAREKLGAAAQLRRATQGTSNPDPQQATTPETWFECMLSLTGMDVLRCPRCVHGRMLRIALKLDTAAPALADTS